MSRIQILPNSVVDQIAAGEVVERPAHLVKELVENSLDAGATEIEILFANGGRSITVKDNGHGIDSKDLELALSRHATSKISESEDLWRLSSYGFRGEALASAAAISELRLVSKTSDGKAFGVDSYFGEVKDKKSTRAPAGTTVEITGLFENVPARLKFLKSESAEGVQIKKIVKSLAMANPSVGFKVKQNGDLINYYQGVDSLLERAKDVLDVDDLFYCEGEYEGIKSKIVFSSPHVTQRNTQNMWFFAQGRFIQDKTLQAGVMEAYRHLLMHGEYPFVAVFLDCPADQIDVNVHPTKSQVKFLNASHAFRAVNRPLRESLELAPWVSQILGGEREYGNLDSDLPNFAPRIKVEENLAFEQPSFEETKFKQKEKTLSESLSVRSETPVEVRARTPVGGEPAWGSLQVLGQSNLTYIIAQSRSALILIDQHAAHERVAFERLMKNWREQKFEVQQSLLPLTVEMEEHLVEGLMTQKEEFERVGLSLSQVSPSSIAVDSRPSILSDSGLSKALIKSANEIYEKGDSFSFERYVGDLFATMACHSVVRAGQSLSLEEMRGLLNSMDEFSLSSFCPHGRPVFVEYSFDRIDKDFGRIV